MQNSADWMRMDGSIIGTPRQAGVYVRKQREKLNLTRAQLASKSGVSERLIASLELGDATGIRLDKLTAILNALGLSLSIHTKDDSGAHYPSAQSTSNNHQQSTIDGYPPISSSYEDLYRSFAARQGIAMRKPPASKDASDNTEGTKE